MEVKPKTEHLLALKVMRLTRPTLASPIVVTCDSTDLPGNTLNNELKNDCTALQGMETLAVGQFMVLPQSFGNIHLGEIFSSYLCVHNGSSQVVKNVRVKADLQTSTQTIALSHKNGQVNELAPDNTVDDVIHHEVKEIGTHILVCEVSYMPASIGSTTQSFRKFFKFEVIKPLDVKTKFCNAERICLQMRTDLNAIITKSLAEDRRRIMGRCRTVANNNVLLQRIRTSELERDRRPESPVPQKLDGQSFANLDTIFLKSDEVYLEAQIQNLTSGPICLEKVALESSHLFTVSTLNSNESGESIYGSVNVLNPGSSRQYLYCLKPQSSLMKDPKMMHNATNIGKLDIVWRSNVGERGRLQTSQLQRMAPDYGDLRVTAKNLPTKEFLENPIEFKCHIINTSERNMDLLLSLESNSSVAWCGISDTMIGTLKPGDSIDVPLSLIPLDTGLVTISGLKLLDTFLKRVYDYEDLGQIFVFQAE